MSKKEFRVSFSRVFQVQVFAATREQATDIARDAVTDNAPNVWCGNLEFYDIEQLAVDAEGDPVERSPHR